VKGHFDNRTSPRPPRSRVARRSVPSSEEAGVNSGMGSSTLSSTTLNQFSNTNTPTHQAFHSPLSPPPVLSCQSTPPSTPTFLKGKGMIYTIKKMILNMELIFYHFVIQGAEKGRFPTTPPPRKKHQTGLPVNTPAALLPDTFPLTKSRSHESQLSNKVDNGNSETGPNRFVVCINSLQDFIIVI
jgi:kinase suppressor of Ras 2